MKSSTVIKVELNPQLLNTIYDTLLVEVSSTDNHRGTITIIKNTHLEISIVCDDFIALRALSNSIMRLLKLSLEVAEI